MTKKPVVLLAVLSLALFGFGCKSPSEMLSEKIAEKATEGIINSQLGGEGEVDLSNGELKFKGKDGDVSYGENLKLSDTFPMDVPVYDGLKIVMSSQKDDSASYLGTVGEKTAAVGGWYWKKLEGDGWKKTSDSNINGSMYREYEKGDRSMTVAVVGDDNADPVSTSVTVSVQKK